MTMQDEFQDYLRHDADAIMEQEAQDIQEEVDEANGGNINENKNNK